MDGVSDVIREKRVFGDLAGACLMLARDFRTCNTPAKKEESCGIVCGYFAMYGMILDVGLILGAMDDRFCRVLERLQTFELMTRRVCAGVLREYYAMVEPLEGDEEVEGHEEVEGDEEVEGHEEVKGTVSFTIVKEACELLLRDFETDMGGVDFEDSCDTVCWYLKSYDMFLDFELVRRGMNDRFVLVIKELLGFECMTPWLRAHVLSQYYAMTEPLESSVAVKPLYFPIPFL